MRSLRLGLLALIIFNLVTGSVMALSDSQRSIYNLGIRYFDTEITSTGCSSSTIVQVTGNDNIATAINFLLSHGLNGVQAAAIIGNLEQESGQGLAPGAVEKKGTGAYPTPGVGFGIAQWTPAGRQQNLIDFAKQQGGQPNDLVIQLGFLWQELSGPDPNNVLQHLKAATSVDDAVNQFVGPNNLAGQPVSPTTEVQRSGGFENPSKPIMVNRLDYAQKVLDKYGSVSGNSSALGCSVGSSCGTQPAAAALSQVRNNVVCLAQQELALWQSQPGYPHPTYSQTGYLKYSSNSPEEWCADFTSWLYKQANYPFSGGVDGWRLPGVSSIQTLGEQDGNFHWHPASSGYTPKPGDLAIHGSGHVNIFITDQGGLSQYIGGDQGDPPYPGGSIVSAVSQSGYYGDITGYVSPD